MKKLMLLFAIFLFLASLSAQDWIEFNASETTTPHYDILQSNDTIVKFNVTIPGMFETAIDTFNRVNIKEHTKMDSVGFPEMPIVSFLVAIPACDSVNLEIELLDSLQFSGYNIYPAPELVADTTTEGAIAMIEKFTYDSTAYSTDAIFPGYVGELMDKGAIRDQHIVRVVLYPLQFNPAKDIIKAYSDFQVTLTFNNPSGSVNNDVGIFNEVVGNTLINYESNGVNASVSCGSGLEDSGSIKWVTSFPNGFIEDTCDYVIITHQDFYTDTVARNKIESLAQHRADFNGFDIVLIKMIDIEEEDTLTGFYNKDKMRNLLSNTFYYGNANHTYDGKLAYVNLFGDAFFGTNPEDECVPTHSEGYDVYFTRLTQVGDKYDDYPDIMLGRCSVDDTTQVKNVVEKIINFSPYDFEYKYQYLQLCDNDDGFYPQINDCFTEIVNITPGDSIFMMTPDDFDNLYFHPEWIYKKPYDIETLQNIYQKELSFLHYMGHGDTTSISVALGFNQDDLDSTHNNRLPFGFFNACRTGIFHYKDECLCESLLNYNSLKGLIGAIGANKSVSFTPVSKMIGYHLMNSLLYNSSVLGSSYIETQLKTTSTNYVSNYFNFFGDPALNLFYENIDTLKADIIISNITTGNLVHKPTDTISVQASLSNIMGVDIDDSFVTACYARMINDGDYTLINTVSIDSLDGFSHKTLTFEILPNMFPEGYYDIKVVVDTNNTVDELSEINNIGFVDITILNIEAINSISSRAPNTNPISYNYTDSSNTDQLIAGNHIFDFDGDIVLKNTLASNGYSSVGTSISDDQKFVNLIDMQTSSVSSISSYTSDSIWTKTALDSTYFGQSSLGFMNNSGDDYILFNDVRREDTCWYYSLTCLDYEFSERWVLEDFSWIYDNTQELNPVRMYPPVCFFDAESAKYLVVTATEDGRIFFVEENQNGAPQMVDTIIIHDCMDILSPLVAAEMETGANFRLALRYKHTNTNSYMALIDFEKLDYDSTLIPQANVLGPWFYDSDNDGDLELILSAKDDGIYLYDKRLNESDISDTTFYKFAGFCDVDNDDHPDMIYEVDEESRYYLKAKNSLDSLIFKKPLGKINSKYAFADKEKNGKVDIIINNSGFLSNIELLEDSKTWQWQGELGNLRNNCNFMQPAYYKTNDTVYWTDNISIPDTFEIPSGATVIVKPDTRIYATEDAEFIVYGKLIAHGSE
nr:hypothetical protein [Bacteroidota bacterium]